MPKRVTLLTVGTRGDVQPFSVLARAFALAGYDVRLGVPENFLQAPDNAALYLQGANVELVRCGPDFRALLEAPLIKDVLSGGFMTKLKSGRLALKLWLDETIANIADAGADSDAILFHPKASFAMHVAEAYKAKAYFCAFQPMKPTGDFPLFLLPYKSLGKSLNRFSYKLLNLGHLVLRGTYNRARKKYFGLRPVSRFAGPYAVSGENIPVLYSISPSLLSKPDDWEDDVHLTGYWSPPPTMSPDWPPDLARFCAEGPAPIYIGFGSMPIEKPAEKADLVICALQAANVRAVIAKGWGGFDPTSGSSLPSFVHIIDNFPHEHLFPRMAGVVHHGGAGTTTAGLRAGCPTLICPFLADQPFWGRRVHDLGAGPPPLPPKGWSVEKLSHAFQDLVENKNYEKVAASIGERMTAEDGASKAVDIVRKGIGAP